MKLPVVEANFAVTADGKISTRAYAPTGFTSARDKRRLLEIRARGDALLVGRQTLETDNMAMALPAADLREERLRRGQTAEPLRVIFTNHGGLSRKLKVFRSGGAPLVVFTTKAMPSRIRSWLEQVADVRVEPRAKQVDLRRALRVLAEDYKVHRAVCEGGPTLLRGLLEAGLLHRLHVTLAPVIFGGAEAPTLRGPAGAGLLGKSVRLGLESVWVEGGEAFATYKVAARRKLASARRGYSGRVKR
jgi:riboflavin-specific deaminase-like protein